MAPTNPMMTFATTLFASIAAAQATIDVGPFNLTAVSIDGSPIPGVNGGVLGGCHAGAGIAQLCSNYTGGPSPGFDFSYPESGSVVPGLRTPSGAVVISYGTASAQNLTFDFRTNSFGDSAYYGVFNTIDAGKSAPLAFTESSNQLAFVKQDSETNEYDLIFWLCPYKGGTADIVFSTLTYFDPDGSPKGPECTAVNVYREDK